MAPRNTDVAPTTKDPTIVVSDAIPAYKKIKEDDLWMIHGRRYDLGSFMDTHPGGRTPLLWAKGRDGTELFESYHTFTEKHRATLKKFEVPFPEGTAPPVWESCFDWSDTSLYNEIKSEVRAYFHDNNIDWTCPPSRWFKIFLLFVQVCVVAVPYYQGYWWSAPVYPFVFWLLGINVFHCASHFGMSHRPWVNTAATYAFSFFSSPTTWAHQHVIGHHTHTNIHRKDPDLNHGVPFFRGHPRFRYRPHYEYQLGYVWFFWATTLFYLSVLLDYFAFRDGGYYKVIPLMWIGVKERKLHVLGRVVSNGLIFFPPFLLFPFWKALFFAGTFMTVFSVCFMMTTQVNHLVPEAVTSRSRDWAEHQIVTAHNFCHESTFWFYFTGGLNMQIEHHLFPNINAYHLIHVTPIVKRICERRGIKYNYSVTYTEAFLKYCKNMSNNATAGKADSRKKE